MRSDQSSKPAPWHKLLLPVQGRWSRYLLCLVLVVGAYVLFWVSVSPITPNQPRIPTVLAAGFVFWIGVRSWRIVADTHPAEAHHTGGQWGALLAFVLGSGAAWFALPLWARSFSFVVGMMGAPLGALIGGAVWGSRAAARERRTGVTETDLFN